MAHKTRLIPLAVSFVCLLGLTPAIAQGIQSSNENLDAAPQQALVLYRTTDDDAVSLLAEGESQLAAAGVSVQQVWDLFDTNANEASLLSTDGEATSSIPNGDDIRIALVEGDAEPEQLVGDLEQLDCVVAAQPNTIGHIAASPDDPLYDTWQYSFNDEQTGIGFDALWETRDTESDDDANIVAVIDTGVDFSHPDLADVAWTNSGDIGLPGKHGYDFSTDDDDPMPDSSLAGSHGTHCAGVIAAETDNGTGMAGIAQRTEIMACKVTEDNSGGALYLASIVKAYQYIIQARLAGENIVAANLSLTLGGYQPVLDYLVNQAGKAGVLSVFTAGNNGSDLEDESAASTSSGTAELPGSSTDQVNSVLLGLPDRLLYLSNQGDYAYQLIDPAQANASWKQLPAAQTPWSSNDAPNSYRSDIVYAELAGTLYAFACDPITTDETMDYVFYVATLDLDDGTAWSAWREAYREEILSAADTYLRSASATTADGRVWFVASTHQYIMDDAGGAYGNAAHLISIDTEGNAQHSLHAAIGMDDVIMQLIGGKSLKAIGSAVSFDLPETTLDLLGYDEQSGTWDYQPLDGPDALTFTDVANLPGTLAATTGTGAVYAGNRLDGLDDLFAIDADSVSAHSLGMLGAASSSGLVVSGVAMSGDALYLACQQPDVEGAAGIYVVDPAVSSKLGAPDVALNAKAETGGIATVNDGLGAAASTDRALVGDIATWSAAPQTGYAFDGWYDAEGTCVSTDATFSTKVTEAAELTARFRATGEQGGGTEQGGGADDPSGTESTPA